MSKRAYRGQVNVRSSSRPTSAPACSRRGIVEDGNLCVAISIPIWHIPMSPAKLARIAEHMLAGLQTNLRAQQCAFCFFQHTARWPHA